MVADWDFFTPAWALEIFKRVITSLTFFHMGGVIRGLGPGVWGAPGPRPGHIVSAPIFAPRRK